MQKCSAPSTSPSCTSDMVRAVQVLNDGCFCITLDQDKLWSTLESGNADDALLRMIREERPHLFSSQTVFLASEHAHRINKLITAVETVVHLPAYRQHVLASAPETARHTPQGQRGVLFGYDFHVQGNHTGLIEINTNAGGIMLNAVLSKAQRACCPPVETFLPVAGAASALEQELLAMFREEWALAGKESDLTTVAIVDENPQQQYLYPEFLLFERLLTERGIRVIVTDPAGLNLSEGRLWHEDTAIDLLYNRLTDFYLEAPEHRALRDAWMQDAIVMTPHPQAHALYADKRHLALLTDASQLQTLGVPEAIQQILLTNIPRTVLVHLENAEQLWRERKQWFFKPATGFGSRAAYRGDKLTTRVWQEILQSDYVAQAIMAPGERAVSEADPASKLKFDLRAYVYNGKVQWLAARLYQGQTTNFRTPGGGFAPVHVASDTQLQALGGFLNRS